MLTHQTMITSGAYEILRFLGSLQHWNQLHIQILWISDHILLRHSKPPWNNDSSRNMPPFPGWLPTAPLTVTSVSSVKTGLNPHTQSFQAKHTSDVCSAANVSTSALSQTSLTELAVFRSLHNIVAVELKGMHARWNYKNDCFTPEESMMMTECFFWRTGGNRDVKKEQKKWLKSQFSFNVNL